MTKTIETLIEDINGVLLHGVESIPEDKVNEFGLALGKMIASKLTTEKEPRKPDLYISNIGSPCERKLWYHVNVPEKSEALTPDAKLKFLYGDILEALLLFLADISGHSVEGTQSSIDLHGVRGRRDAIIDGTLVDAKSASSFAFKKFKEGRLEEDDPFGYIPQLMGYLEVGQTDELVKDKSRAAFFVVDKTLGHLCLDFHKKKDWDWKEIVEYKRGVVNSSETPDRSFEPTAMGKSGNLKLGTFCSYCNFKKECYPELRTFIYSDGPVFLTHVEKEPNVFEVVDDKG